MSQVARIGDVCGGEITTGSDTVYVDGIPVARIGDSIAPHGDGEHASAEVATGSSSVYVNGIPVARTGDAGTCGDIISTGSTSVMVGE